MYLYDARYSTRLFCRPIDLRIEIGDWLILGTDGLFDNMKTEEVLESIADCDGKYKVAHAKGIVIYWYALENVEPQVLAHRLAQTAMEFSMDENKTSPFAENANEAGFVYLGGKCDDITVVVGKVMR